MHSNTDTQASPAPVKEISANYREFLGENEISFEQWEGIIASSPKRAIGMCGAYAESMGPDTDAGRWALKAMAKLERLFASLPPVQAEDGAEDDAPQDEDEEEDEEEEDTEPQDEDKTPDPSPAIVDTRRAPSPAPHDAPESHSAPALALKPRSLMDAIVDTVSDASAEIPVFAFHNLRKVIGQKVTVERLESAVVSAAMGREVPSYAATGQAGLGKTRVAHAFAADLAIHAGWEVIHTTPGAIRLTSENSPYQKLIRAIINPSKRVLVTIDEAHDLQKNTTVQTKKILAILLLFLDGNNEGKVIQVDDKHSITCDKKRLAFVVMTNFPKKLDPSGALLSRCQTLDLVNYTEDELVQILQGMLRAKGYRAADEDTLRIMANCGRGTARPMEKLIQEINQFVFKSSVNRKDVMKALYRKGMFPEGLDFGEVELLMRLASPLKLATIKAIFPSLENAALKGTLGYLLAKGFLSLSTQGFYQMTDYGNEYIGEIRKAKFQLPGDAPKQD